MTVHYNMYLFYGTSCYKLFYTFKKKDTNDFTILNLMVKSQVFS